MSELTKKAIRKTFLRLLAERPLDRITVKDIAEECGINRNTFYYHFRDVPDLIEDIVISDTEKILGAYPAAEKPDDCIGAFIEMAMAHKRAVLHIYHSANREIYERYMWEICDRLADVFLSKAFDAEGMSEEDVSVLKKCFSDFAFGILSRWLKNDMTEDIRADFARVMRIKNEKTTI